jgi:hypothetical protein
MRPKSKRPNLLVKRQQSLASRRATTSESTNEDLRCKRESKVSASAPEKLDGKEGMLQAAEASRGERILDVLV